MGYVTYVELNVANLEESSQFYSDVFGWNPAPFGGPDYLVAQHGDEPGIDTGLMASRDGQPRTIAVISVDSIDQAIADVEENGGRIVVEKHTIPTVGYAAYFTDPGGLLVGLHQFDPQAA